jgi:hypothetical protein
VAVEEEQRAPAQEILEEDKAPESERRLVLWLTNISHAVNHFQNNMVAALYPVIMADLGFGYFQLGAITAVRTVFGNASQGMYGFITAPSWPSTRASPTSAACSLQRPPACCCYGSAGARSSSSSRSSAC